MMTDKPPVVVPPGEEGYRPSKINVPHRVDPPEDIIFLSGLRLRFDGRRETVVDDRVVVWTDGSRFDHGGRSRAGAGIFYGRNNPSNAGVGVGGKRTAQRAELMAFVHVLRTETRPFEVRTDSRYVADGVNLHITYWRRNAWYAGPQLAEYIEHADLWFEVNEALRLGRAFKVVWVKGHGTVQLVAEGKTTELDAWGNGGADFNAQTAARQCPNPDDVAPLQGGW